MSSSEMVHEVSARAVYDESADQYVAAIGTELTTQVEAPLDLAVLGAFAESVLAHDNSAAVLDVGCGPGRAAAFLAARGLAAQGRDISPRMVEAARLAHPELSFEVGSLVSTGVGDREFAAVVYWYSIIATPLGELAAVWAELDRVLCDGGTALIAFQSGANDEVVRPNAHGTSTTLTLFCHNVDDVVATLNARALRLAPTSGEWRNLLTRRRRRHS